MVSLQRDNLRGFPGSMMCLVVHATVYGEPVCVRHAQAGSASPSHPHTHGSPQRWPCSHHGCSCVGFGVRSHPHRLEERFRNTINVRGVTASPTACTMLCVRFVSRVHRNDSGSARDATLDTGGWLALTRQGRAPCKTHQASPGALTPAISFFGDALDSGQPHRHHHKT